MSVDRRTLISGGAALAAMASSGLTRAHAAPKTGMSGFLWGAATAAHQIEGQNLNSDYWVLEHIPATYFKEVSGDACDSLHRWGEDLALVKSGGMNAYRFSIEWARIEPEQGEISAAMLDHYRRICSVCRELGIEPVVTFHHFTSPRWVAARGGWENPETADDFARFAGIAAKALGPELGSVCTMNEPNAQVTSKVMLLDKPWDKEPGILAQAAKAVGSDRFGAYFIGNPYKTRDVCIDAHRKAREAIKSAAPHTRIGLTLALQDNAPGPDGERLFKRVYDEARAPFYAVARDDDFIGVQTYNRGIIGKDGYLPTTDATMRDRYDLDSSPKALQATTTEAHRETGRPVFVTENGINTDDDALRIRHMRESVSGLATLIDGGMPVLGYMQWTLMDNFEWSSGYVPRFGLAAVDRVTFKRTPKPSHQAYGRLIADMRARHRWA